MTIYGYARVSTDHQDLTPQIEELKAYGCEEIFQEKASGKNADERPVLKQLIETAQAGDKVVFTKLDRFARSTKDALDIAEQLREKGVQMVILNFGGDTINLFGPSGKLIFTMFSAIAEFEREIMLERQRAGIERAKQAGKYKGRVKKYTDKHLGMKHAIELVQTTDKTIKEICDITGVSRAALYRRMKELGIERTAR